MPITHEQFLQIHLGDKFITENDAIWTACSLQWLMDKAKVTGEHFHENGLIHAKVFAYYEKDGQIIWNGWVTQTGKVQSYSIKALVDPRTNQIKKPRKHSELIKLWADGAIIQSRIPGIESSQWKDAMDNEPSWTDDLEYRVKPPDDYYRYAIVDANGFTQFTKERKGFSNVKVTFDGETNFPKNIQMI